MKKLVQPRYLALFLLAGSFLLLGAACSPSKVNIAQPDIPLVGNDRDEHGCLPSAGYSWCAVKNKCLRMWEEKCEQPAPQLGQDPQNTNYLLGGQQITLVNGQAVIVDAKQVNVTTKIFSEPVYSDIGAGPETALVFLVQSINKTDYYYAAAAYKKDGRYYGTNAIFLGDRIAPDTIWLGDGVAAFNYAAQASASTTLATEGVSKYVIIKNERLTEIQSLDEGELVMTGIMLTRNNNLVLEACDDKATNYLIKPSSQALAELKTANNDYVVVSGAISPAEKENILNGYKYQITIKQLIRSITGKTCQK